MYLRIVNNFSLSISFYMLINHPLPKAFYKFFCFTLKRGDCVQLVHIQVGCNFPPSSVLLCLVQKKIDRENKQTFITCKSIIMKLSTFKPYMQTHDYMIMHPDLPKLMK